MDRRHIICLVSNDLSHDQRMIRICTTLHEAGYVVWLVGRRKRQSPALAQRPYRQIRLGCWFERGKLFYIEYNLRLLFFLLWRRFDIVNAVDLDTLAPAFLVAQLKHRPCVYDAHEYFTETPEVVRRPTVQGLWEWLAEKIIPRLDYCYTVGDALARELSRRYRVPFATIRNLPRARPQAEQARRGAEKIILYQGMLNEGRGLETAIAAMAHLPDCQLWLVGDGDLTEALRRQVTEAGLSKRITFWGFVPPEELPAINERAWLGLNLLENRGKSYYYSLANKAFDYIQAGLPSLQMAFPEYRQLNQQYDVFLLLERLDTGELTRTVQLLLRQPWLYEQLQHNCQAAARQLTWEWEQTKLLYFYRNIL